MLNGLDLFSGIGGIGLALAPWVRTAAYCEADQYCQAVLMSRMQSGDIDLAPIWDDVRTLRAEFIKSPIDIIFGGFPCQDISVAGNGGGLDGERSGLFREILRLAGELRPSFIFLENVPAITVRGLDRVLMGITALGYDCRWSVVSAAEMGAPHLRERWFLLGYTNRGRVRYGRERDSRRHPETDHQPEHKSQEVDTESETAWREKSSEPRGSVTDACRAGLERWALAKPAWEAFRLGSGSGSEAWPHWLPQPSLCRGDDGIRNRVVRLRGLGNAVVPAQAREAFERLMGLK